MTKNLVSAKKHSTSHAFNYSIQHFNQAIKNKEHVLGILINLSKAFDTIDHKLRSYGVRGIAHSLIESYLSNRKQYVSVPGENLDLADVIYGVPQGSCLGLILFLIYMNDISNTSNEGEFILFADDTNIFVRGQTALRAFKTANEILRKVCKQTSHQYGKMLLYTFFNLVILIKK